MTFPHAPSTLNRYSRLFPPGRDSLDPNAMTDLGLSMNRATSATSNCFHLSPSFSGKCGAKFSKKFRNLLNHGRRGYLG